MSSEKQELPLLNLTLQDMESGRKWAIECAADGKASLREVAHASRTVKRERQLLQALTEIESLKAERTLLSARVDEYLAKETEAVEAMAWRDCTVEMPEYDTDVHLWAPGWDRVHLGYWRHSHEWIGRQRPESEEELPDTNPTKWMPLPAPPASPVPEKETK